MILSGDLKTKVRSFAPDLELSTAQVRGTRELRSAFVDLSLRAAKTEIGPRGLLAVSAPLMTSARLHTEWESFTSLLRPDIASKLALVATGVDGVVALPKEPLTEFVANLMGAPTARFSHARAFRWDRKRFEVFAVLFDAWLQREPAVSVTDLLLKAGVSYPTARVTLDALQQQYGIVERTRGRAATLSGWPRRALEELVPRLDELRASQLYVDASGRGTSPESLLARVLRRKPDAAGIAAVIGGVAAARHVWPGFDLNGTPRVDLTVPFGTAPEWLNAIDPALRSVPSSTAGGVILAVHHTHGLPTANAVWARPSTVVFDVFSLGLSAQAEDLIRRLRA